ncbi:MAG: phospholipase D-like domain-containing protein [Zestosphaera sp.]|uniref:phospholipase D-like domain-containing protein n=1 Tax=Thermofilum sp. TaxID=1961369 RepID=UPI003166BF8A
MSEDKKDLILRMLKEKGGCAYALEVKEATGMSWRDLVEEITTLESQNLIKKQGPPVDLTKPIATTKWCISEKSEGGLESIGLGTVVSLILNPPVLRILRIPPQGSIGLVDSLQGFVCSASKNLRIIMPYLGDFVSLLFLNCADRLKGLSRMRIITERNQSNYVLLERLKRFFPNLEVAYATKEAMGVKIEGAHAKLIIIDEDYALIGTFNLTELHLLVNFDVGVVVKGEVVRILAGVFDKLWDAVKGDKDGKV